MQSKAKILGYSVALGAMMVAMFYANKLMDLVWYYSRAGIFFIKMLLAMRIATYPLLQIILIVFMAATTVLFYIKAAEPKNFAAKILYFLIFSICVSSICTATVMLIEG